MAFVDNTFEKIRICLPVLAHNEETRLYVLGLQDIQDLRRPSRIGSVVECQDDLAGLRVRFRPVSSSLNQVRRGYRIIDLAKRAAGAGYRPRAVLRSCFDLQDFAGAIEIDVV